jgi:hypothetical protein
VVSLLQHRPRAPQRAVHRASEPRGERLHPAPELPRVVRFHDQVSVIALDRVVDEPEAPALAPRRERDLDRAHDARAAQRRDVAAHLERDVTRPRAIERFAAGVRNVRLRAPRPARVLAASAPARLRAQTQCELPSALFHTGILALGCVGPGHDVAGPNLDFRAVDLTRAMTVAITPAADFVRERSLAPGLQTWWPFD